MSSLIKHHSGNTTDDICHFTGNLGVYRREFALLSSAGPGPGRQEASESGNTLIQRGRTRKTRRVSRTGHDQSFAGPLVHSSQTSTRTRYYSLLVSHGKLVSAIVGCLFLGVAVGNISALSSSITSNAEPEPSRAATTETTLSAKDVVVLKKRVEESGVEAETYRNEASELRDRVNSLSNENSALAEETLELNRELLGLETTVLSLRSGGVCESSVTSRVVYNFVNVPIGSDPDASFNVGARGLASNRQAADLSYNNSPDLSNQSSAAIAQSELQEAFAQLGTDEPSNEHLDEIIGRMIAEGSDSN